MNRVFYEHNHYSIELKPIPFNNKCYVYKSNQTRKWFITLEQIMNSCVLLRFIFWSNAKSMYFNPKFPYILYYC